MFRMTKKNLAIIEAARRHMQYDIERKVSRTGMVARLGYHWVRNAMTGVTVEEQDGTEWCCSVASESYWSR